MGLEVELVRLCGWLFCRWTLPNAAPFTALFGADSDVDVRVEQNQ